MSTTAPVTLDLSKSGPTPFSRLVKVEWRKMVDTRGGLWLMGITAGLLLLVMALVVLVVGLNDGRVDGNDLSQVFTIPVSLLLPVFAILTVTSEWSQRTALASFTLEPHRGRVILAKLVAVSALAVATIVVAFVVGAVTNVLCALVTDNPLAWNLDLSTLVWIVISQLAFFAMGFALACLMLNTPGAISVFYVVALLMPLMVWSTLYAIFDWAKDVLPWIDINTAITPLTTDGYDIIGEPVDVGLVNYVQGVWTLVLWVGIPVTLGMWRILRAEVK
ncbi:ABC transporter permease subunit [Nocardioides sp. J54]|uniref:ABC transporter permease subunit n=1 Tax=Nocardioides sp. J54 TaxID=935866 RepID=UPI0004913463|nr:ABC transporter permease subunit [Nocardioides sp. J54]